MKTGGYRKFSIPSVLQEISQIYLFVFYAIFSLFHHDFIVWPTVLLYFDDLYTIYNEQS